MFGFELDDQPAALEGSAGKFAEEDRLSDPAKAAEDDASGCEPVDGAVGEDLERFDVAFSAGERRWSQSGTGAVRVGARVHQKGIAKHTPH